MTPEIFREALVLTGPTGSGKSRLALELAQRLGAEIVAMDSMTLYRGMDIGTAKPSRADQAQVPHHLLDQLDPWESASVAWWLEKAGQATCDIQARGKRVLFVGGTPMYLKALLFGLFEGPAADPQLRAQLEAEATERGPEALHARLAQVDPESARRLHGNDVRRVVRALEVFQLTGQPLSVLQTQWRAEDRSVERAAERGPRCLYLDPPREELYSRINARVLDMVRAGLVEEVRWLHNLVPPAGKEARQALGYKELFAHLEGTLSLAQAIEQIQLHTRHFAKRQWTWFRHLPRCQPATSAELAVFGQ